MAKLKSMCIFYLMIHSVLCTARMSPSALSSPWVCRPQFQDSLVEEVHLSAPDQANLREMEFLKTAGSDSPKRDMTLCSLNDRNFTCLGEELLLGLEIKDTSKFFTDCLHTPSNQKCRHYFEVKIEFRIPQNPDILAKREFIKNKGLFHCEFQNKNSKMGADKTAFTTNKLGGST